MSSPRCASLTSMRSPSPTGRRRCARSRPAGRRVAKGRARGDNAPAPNGLNRQPAPWRPPARQRSARGRATDGRHARGRERARESIRKARPRSAWCSTTRGRAEPGPRQAREAPAGGARGSRASASPITSRRSRGCSHRRTCSACSCSTRPALASASSRRRRSAISTRAGGRGSCGRRSSKTRRPRWVELPDDLFARRRRPATRSRGSRPRGSAVPDRLDRPAANGDRPRLSRRRRAGVLAS